MYTYISLNSACSTLRQNSEQAFPFNYFTYYIEISMFLIFQGLKLLPEIKRQEESMIHTQQTINTISVNTQQLQSKMMVAEEWH